VSTGPTTWSIRPSGSARGQPAFWLEQARALTIVDAMVLGRAAFAAREVLRRTRSAYRAAGPADDPAAMEVLLDAGASDADRAHAARLLRLPTRAVLRAVAVAGCTPRVEAADDASPDRWAGLGRTGVGPAVFTPDLPGATARGP